MYPIKLYIRHRPTLIMLPLALFLNISIWVWLLWNIRPQEDPIFLHYSVLFGVDLTGPWYQVLAIPTVGLVMILLHAFLGWFFFERDKFISHILQATSLIAHCLLLVAASLLVFLNI